MQPGQPRLAIDYGTVTTVAVLAWPDGRWMPLRFDDSVVLPSAVQAVDGELVTGPQAWQLAVTDPEGFVAAPLRMGIGTVEIAGTATEVEALLTATLRRVATEAARVVGESVTDVRMVVPAGWGPQRRTWLRHAAYRAGLGQPRLVQAPVVAADLVMVMGVPVPVGAFLLMVDLGSGCEVTVLRREVEDFEVLSTLADPDAAGSAIDELLVADAIRHHGSSHAVAGVHPAVVSSAASAAASTPDGEPGPGARWAVLAAVRQGKEAASQHAAVTVALPPPAPAMILTSAGVQDIARPVVQRAADLAGAAVTAAEITTEQLFGVYCIGATSDTPAVPQIFGETLGVVPAVLPDPGMVAVVGAAGVSRLDTAPGGGPAPALPVPAVRRAIALTVPGVASLVLVAQFLSTTMDDASGRAVVDAPANWGELTMASVFAVLTCLAAGSLLGILLIRLEQSRPGRKPPPRSPERQVGQGVVAAAAIGIAVAGLYAVVTALYIGQAISAPLRWALYPAVAIAVLAATVTLIMIRRDRAQGSDGDLDLSFPPSAVILAATGMFLVQHTLSAHRWPDLAVFLDLGTRFGGLLIGVGTAFILVKVWVLRLILALPLGIFMATVVTERSTGVLAIIFMIAVLWWWAYRLLDLLRSPSQVPEHVD